MGWEREIKVESRELLAFFGDFGDAFGRGREGFRCLAGKVSSLNCFKADRWW